LISNQFNLSIRSTIFDFHDSNPSNPSSNFNSLPLPWHPKPGRRLGIALTTSMPTNPSIRGSSMLCAISTSWRNFSQGPSLNHKLLKLLKSVLPGKKFAMFLLTMTEPSTAVDSWLSAEQEEDLLGVAARIGTFFKPGLDAYRVATGTRMTIQMSIRSERWLFEKGQNSRLLQAYVLINSPNKIFISTLTTGFANRKHLPLFYGYIKDSNTERLITFILLVSE